MRAFVAILLITTALSGCSEDPAPSENTQDLGDLDDQLEATDTTGVIRGVVVDDAIVPVEGVTITLQGSGLTTQTNEVGAFGFSDLDPGTYFLEAAKAGFNTTQASATVQAGVDRPPVLKIQLARNPESGPYTVPTYYAGFLACGVAVFATSIGCTILAEIAALTDSTSIWRHEFDNENIMWTQGELVWEHNQPAGGMLIWEITGRNNNHIGYRETGESPALAYINHTIMAENPRDIQNNGVDYRYFGGPHPLCRLPEPVERPPEAPVWYSFGCGVTIDQSAEAFIHDFYNFIPPEGWRYTSDGDPVPPQ